MAIFYTYVVRPGDAPRGRMPSFQPFWQACMDYNLRFGLALELFAVLLLSTVPVITGCCGIGLIHATQADTRMTSTICASVCILASLMWAGGAAALQAFRNQGDDESCIKFSRGYRGGTKGLAVATTLDLVQASMMSLFFFGQLTYFDDKWTAESIVPNPMAIFTLVMRLVHACALFVYAGSFLYLEGFHAEGTSDVWGWLISVLYKTAGLLELGALITGNAIADMAFTGFLFLGVAVAFVWANQFEPVLNVNEVPMDQSAVRNEYFKSHNAMAYYGPILDGGADIARAPPVE